MSNVVHALLDPAGVRPELRGDSMSGHAHVTNPQLDDVALLAGSRSRTRNTPGW